MPVAGAATVVEARPRRRLEMLTRSQDSPVVRVSAGQLPTYERAYLLGELRRIAIVSGLLLTLIVVLAIVLR